MEVLNLLWTHRYPDGILRRMRIPRVLLLDIINTDPLSIFRNDCFPFFQAWLRARGPDVVHVFVGVDCITAATGRNRYIYSFPADDEPRLLARIAEIAPTHVILNERLEEELFRRLCDTLPGVPIRMVTKNSLVGHARRIASWLDLAADGFVEGNRLLVDEVAPDFSGTPLNTLACTIRPPLALLVGPDCTWSSRLDRNPAYAGIDAAELATLAGSAPPMTRQDSCSFCQSGSPDTMIARTPPVELAVRQIRSALATSNPLIHDPVFRISGTNLLPRMDELATRLEREGIEGCTLMFSSRIDDFLRVEAAVAKALPVLARTRNVLRIWNMGLENLSPAENQRFNKGIDPATIDRGCDLLQRFLRDHAGTFRFDGFGFILFTPWTTFHDLRLNVEGIRRHGMEGVMFFLRTALQLFPGRPITLLAQKDGLATSAFDDLPGDSGGITTHDQVEIPWRFRDRRVGLVFSIARRLGPTPIIPDDDPALRLVATWYRSLPASLQDPLTVFEALVDVGEASPENVTLAGILGHAERRLAAGAGPDEAASPDAGPRARNPVDDVRRLMIHFADTLAPGGPEGSDARAMGVEDFRVEEGPEGPSIAVRLQTDGKSWEAVLDTRRNSDARYLEIGGVNVHYRGEIREVRPVHQAIMKILAARAARFLGRPA